MGGRCRASRCRRARSSASPAWSAPAGRSCSRACSACGRAPCERIEIDGARGRDPQPARGGDARPHLSERGPQGQGPARRFRPAGEPDADGAASATRGLGCDPRAERAALRQAVQATSASAPARSMPRAARCRAATSRSWRSRRCCSPSRRWSCSTSRRAASTSAPSARSTCSIQRLAPSGRAVIVISSELMELVGLCHRVVVMRAGRGAGDAGHATC